MTCAKSGNLAKAQNVGGAERPVRSHDHPAQPRRPQELSPACASSAGRSKAEVSSKLDADAGPQHRETMSLSSCLPLADVGRCPHGRGVHEVQSGLYFKSSNAGNIPGLQRW